MISKLAVFQSCLALCALLSSSVLHTDALRSGKRLTAEMQENKMMSMMALKENYWMENRATLKDEESVIGRPEACTSGSITINGVAYACNNVNLLGYMARSALRITRPGFNDPLQELSDIWGWTSPSGKEITIVCLTTGVRFIDTTDPTQPKNLGYMAAVRTESFWSDVKVYKNVAYIVKDSSSNPSSLLTSGIQVFNLLRLEQVDGSTDVAFLPDFVYPSHSTSHNVVVNTETGFLYTVGNKGDSCSGGLHMISLADPLRPVFAGCAGADGYVHDAQCVVYRGPDTRFTGREICFGYNEDTLTIYDVTVKSAPVILSRKGYVGARYTHQGWLNQDMDYLLLDDELDEESGLIATTKTFVVDVRDLTNPVFTGAYDHGTTSIDHNLYMWGPIHRNGWGGSPAMANPPSDNYAYCSNYCAGLRILDITGMKQSPPVISTAGFFDVSPCSTTQDWYGAWSNYMHPSGVIAVASIDMGLFLLDFPKAFDSPATEAPVTSSPTQFPTPVPTNAPTPLPTPAPVTAAPVTAAPGFIVTDFPTVALTAAPVTSPVTPSPVFVVTDFPTVALTAAPVTSPVTVPTTAPVLPPSSGTVPTATNAPVPTTSGGSDGGLGDLEGSFLGIVIGLFAAIIVLVAAIICVYVKGVRARAVVAEEVKVKPIVGSYGAPIGAAQKI